MDPERVTMQTNYVIFDFRKWWITDDTKSDEEYLDAEGNDIRVKPDATIVSMVDPLLQQYDRNNDGYVEYYEYKSFRDVVRGKA